MAGFLNKIEEELRDLEEWNDRHDVVGLTPGNWVSPIDFTPIGWINKGRKAYKAAKTGYKLGRRGLTTFGKAAYKESKRHSISAAGSLVTKAMQRYESSGSSSRAYQQNGSPGGTSSKKGPRDSKPDTFPARKFSRMGKHHCPDGYDLKKVKGRWMCVRSSTRKR